MTPAAQYLEENGPSTMGEMPNDKLSISDKQAGIWKFYGNWSSLAGARPGGQTQTIFYLRGKHTARQVVRAWIDANETQVEKLPKQSLMLVLNRNGSEFTTAIRELVKEAKADVESEA